MNNNENLHQKLMNEAYDLWQLPANKHWSIRDFLINLDPLHRRAVVIGHLNYQVENGGFFQYYSNGYLEAGKEFLADALNQLDQTIEVIEVKNLFAEVIDVFLTHHLNEDDYPNDQLDERLDGLDNRYYEIAIPFLSQFHKYLEENLD